MEILESPPALSGALGGAWSLRPLHASSFCDTWEASQGTLRLFVKSAPRAGAGQLRAEADGLRALAATGCIRVPQVHALTDLAGGGAALAMEWLDFRAPDARFGARFGEAMAALHAHPCPLEPAGFGWRGDNCIGGTPQRNTPLQPASWGGWLQFWGRSRLCPMRDRLPASASALREAVDAVIERMPDLFSDGYQPRPALIHGDLWQGNWDMLADGTPVIFDPAVSCSDPEAEIAMMELFGSPPAGFRAAYEAAGGRWPSPQRMKLYQLYHLLNHVVLFGGGYAVQALQVARALA
ncbi:fructosamine kinase family protein [Ramlibacter sp. USB13]|uniref:Fructosamine kinase family protein n=2 Tax=Ramlibacter cellulosilyticus TaxID=2764187 RepID=A0A923MVY8_9BURK|nr:fructosamine kinase family protein [Ramlibacter cellulosilyticus]